MFGINLEYYFVCWVGTIILFFRLKSDNKAVMRFIQLLNPLWENKPLTVILDMLLFTFAGAFVGTILTQPANVQQSLATGLGWTGLMSSIYEKAVTASSTAEGGKGNERTPSV